MDFNNRELTLNKATNIEKVLEYVDDEHKEKMAALLDTLTVKCFILRTEPAKWDEKRNLKWLLANLVYIRGNKQIEVEYHFSHNDAETFEWNGECFNKYSQWTPAIKTNMLARRDDFLNTVYYNALCTAGFTMNDQSESFSDFCDTFGYNNDSIKDRDIFLETLELKRKFLMIFNREEAEWMPS